MSERYTIGEAAKKLQVSTRTLRFYEEKDLVRPAYTEENGYRFYSEEQIRQIELILFLKELFPPYFRIHRLLNQSLYP